MKKNTFLVLSIFLIGLSSTATAGKLYKWIDANGKLSFSDRLPPQDSRREHEELNDSGRTIAIKDAAKTPEQIQQLKKIIALQKTQEKLLQIQLSQDSALLKTFRSESDIDALASSKLGMINSHISIAMGQSKTLIKQLIVYQKDAAKFERSGKKIPKKNILHIDLAQTQLDKNQHEILEFNSQKIELTEQLGRDKSRFRTLKSLSRKRPSINSETIPSLFLGEISCNVNTCNSLWGKSTSFIKEAGANIVYKSDNLILTKSPRLSKDTGLSLTKTKGATHVVITLDIRCIDSKGGKATCKSKQTAHLATQFNLLGD